MTTIKELDLTTGELVERPMTDDEKSKRDERIEHQAQQDRVVHRQGLIKRLEEIDVQSIRAMRSVSLGGNGPDQARLEELEAEAAALRSELSNLGE